MYNLNIIFLFTLFQTLIQVSPGGQNLRRMGRWPVRSTEKPLLHVSAAEDEEVKVKVVRKAPQVIDIIESEPESDATQNSQSSEPSEYHPSQSSEPSEYHHDEDAAIDDDATIEPEPESQDETGAAAAAGDGLPVIKKKIRFNAEYDVALLREIHMALDPLTGALDWDVSTIHYFEI